MKNRNWSKTLLWVASVAGALALLIFIATAHNKRTESSLRVRQGQEIVLGDNKIVVGKIEDGQAEISVYRNGEAAQPILLQHEKPDKPDKPDPCPCSCSGKPGKDPGDVDHPRHPPR